MTAHVQTAARIVRLATMAEAHRLDAVIVTSAAGVKHLSGYHYYFEYGASPFQLLPAALSWIPGHTPQLIIADNEVHRLGAVNTSVAIRPYTAYTYKAALHFSRKFTEQLIQSIRQAGVSQLRIGIEKDTFPFSVAEAFLNTFSHIEFIDINSELQSMRSVKDEDEIEAIKRAAALSDIGQKSVLKNARPGISELELFHIVRNDIDAIASTRVPLMADLSSGVLTSSGGGMPTGKIIAEGETVLSDFTPCLDGYWGDSCNTIVVGKATSEHKRIFQLVREALAIGLQAVRPGYKACEVDAVMRAHLKHEGSFDHHGGHGVGTVYHEEPRITPYNPMVLLPNMVIALEPAVYKHDFGIRLEHLVRVTTKGHELLTQFNHQLSQE